MEKKYLERIVFNYETKEGFTYMNLSFSPKLIQEEQSYESSQLTKALKSEYYDFINLISNKLGYEANYNSLEQKISNNSISEEIKLQKSFKEKKNIFNLFQNKYEEKTNSLGVSYRLSDYPTVDIKLLDLNLEQDEIVSIYNNIVNDSDVIYLPTAIKTKNQIDLILNRDKNKPINVVELLEY